MRDLTDKKFSRWLVTSYSRHRGHNHMWNCVCECGTSGEVAQGKLEKGLSKGCRKCKTHGSPKGVSHHLYKYGRMRGLGTTVMNVIQRCGDEASPAYPNYGGRGIKVWEPWLKNPSEFKTYLHKLWEKQTGETSLNRYGVRAEQLTLDRIDNEGDYEPGNLRFATRGEQARNQRIRSNPNIRNQIRGPLEAGERTISKFR